MYPCLFLMCIKKKKALAFCMKTLYYVFYKYV